MIADLHCHYPMHLLPGDRHPHGTTNDWFQRLKDELDADLEDIIGRIVNNPRWEEKWRVDLPGLAKGGVRIVCSVLYWPADEWDFLNLHGAPPSRGSFGDLKHQLGYVEEYLKERDPDGERHLIVKERAHLDDDDPRVKLVHCVEGGFHLGPEVNAIEDNVRELGERGVVYITLAHLFFREVATNAPAIPALSDEEYDSVFPQTEGIGLTALGEAAVRAMHKHKVLVDISHMREDAIAETFALVKQLDEEAGTAPTDYPVIATHVGMRDAGPDAQAYNLTPDTVRAIKERKGVIGLILAQHQLGATKDPAESAAVLRKHINAIEAVAGSHEYTAIGTDLDGFINPVLNGIERAPDLTKLDEWIRDEYEDDADAILHGNALRVLKTAFANRP